MEIIRAYKSSVRLMKYFSRMSYLLIDSNISKIDNILLIDINCNYYS